MQRKIKNGDKTVILDYIKQAFELKSQNCYKQAIEMLYKALEIENDNIEILFQLGELYFLLFNYDRAKQYLEKVLQKSPQHVDSLKILGKIYADEPDKALKCAQAVYELQNTPENLAELIKILSKQGKLDEVKKLADGSDDAAVVYEYAKALFDNGKPEQAREVLEDEAGLPRFARNDEENAGKTSLVGAGSACLAMTLLGKIYFNKNELDKAKEIFAGLTEETPEVLNYRGLFALEEMKFIDAIKLFSKAANLDKQNPLYPYNLGNAYFYNGWFEEASGAYLKAVCLAPQNMDYRYALAYLYYENRQFEKARKELDLIFSNSPNHASAVVLNALLKVKNKDFLGAQRDLERSITKGNDDDFTLVSLAGVYRELGMADKALEITQKIIARNPQNLGYKCNLAEVYIKDKKYAEALSVVDEVISRGKNFIAAYILGACAALESDDLGMTKFYAQSAISLDMNYAPGYYYLALVRAVEKDYAEAIECMKRAITADPGNALYYAKMAQICKSAGDVKMALDYVKEAVSIDSLSEYQTLYTELASLNRKAKG